MYNSYWSRHHHAGVKYAAMEYRTCYLSIIGLSNQKPELHWVRSTSPCDNMVFVPKQCWKHLSRSRPMFLYKHHTHANQSSNNHIPPQRRPRRSPRKTRRARRTQNSIRDTHCIHTRRRNCCDGKASLWIKRTWKSAVCDTRYRHGCSIECRCLCGRDRWTCVA